jgi:acetyl esterase/lipase
MPSWQSYLLNLMLRLQVKRKLPGVKSVEDARAIFSTPLPPPAGAVFTPEILGGVPGEWATASAPPAGTLLYLHGGGYFSCSPTTYRALTGAFALRGFKTYVPDYRLAPENPFPAALDDALAAYKALLANGLAPTQIALAGDSAGGGLALAMLLAAKAENLPLPACAILFSPWTDLAITGASIQTNRRRESMLHSHLLADGAALYLAGTNPKNPLVSPLYGNLIGLPPLLLQAGKPEILRDDSTRLATRAQTAGVPTTLTLWPNMPHGWHLFQAQLPEARAALAEAASFATRHLAQNQPGA